MPDSKDTINPLSQESSAEPSEKVDSKEETETGSFFDPIFFIKNPISKGFLPSALPIKDYSREDFEQNLPKWKEHFPPAESPQEFIEKIYQLDEQMPFSMKQYQDIASILSQWGMSLQYTRTDLENDLRKLIKYPDQAFRIYRLQTDKALENLSHQILQWHDEDEPFTTSDWSWIRKLFGKMGKPSPFLFKKTPEVSLEQRAAKKYSRDDFMRDLALFADRKSITPLQIRRFWDDPGVSKIIDAKLKQWNKETPFSTEENILLAHMMSALDTKYYTSDDFVADLHRFLRHKMIPDSIQQIIQANGWDKFANHMMQWDREGNFTPNAIKAIADLLNALRGGAPKTLQYRFNDLRDDLKKFYESGSVLSLKLIYFLPQRDSIQDKMKPLIPHLSETERALFAMLKERLGITRSFLNEIPWHKF